MKLESSTKMKLKFLRKKQREEKIEKESVFGKRTYHLHLYECKSKKKGWITISQVPTNVRKSKYYISLTNDSKTTTKNTLRRNS